MSIGVVKQEVENERKVSVTDPARLPNPLPPPRRILQGYWYGPDADVSLRLVPAEGRAWWRRKAPAHGPTRDKTKVEVPYEGALPHLYAAPAVAVKDRYTFDDGGRTWKLEQFDDGHMQAETEDDAPDLGALPAWAGTEITAEPAAYSGSRARKRSAPELDALLGYSPKARPLLWSRTRDRQNSGGVFRRLPWRSLRPSRPARPAWQRSLLSTSRRSTRLSPLSAPGSKPSGVYPAWALPVSPPPCETPSGNISTITADFRAARLRTTRRLSSPPSSGAPKPSSCVRQRVKAAPRVSSAVLAYRRAALAPAVRRSRACMTPTSPTSTGNTPTAFAPGIPSRPDSPSARRPAWTTSPWHRSLISAGSASTSMRLMPVRSSLAPLPPAPGAGSGVLGEAM